MKLKDVRVVVFQDDFKILVFPEHVLVEQMAGDSAPNLVVRVK